MRLTVRMFIDEVAGETQLDVSGSRCRVCFVPSRAMPELLNHFSVDKFDDLLHRLSRCGRACISLDETFGLALEERELYPTSCLPIVLDEAIDVGTGMSLIACALKTDHRGHFNPLTAFKGAHRASFGHRVL